MVRVEAVAGDITEESVDAIVNAANSSLLGGGGVDGAIHRAAGPELLAACRAARRELPAGLPVGEAVVTPGFRLPARWVVHTVGPNWHRGQRDEALLAACFRNSLTAAAEVGAKSVAFPAISAGVYGWALPTVARVAVAAARTSDADVDLVRFVLFSADALAAFQAALAG